MYTMHRWLATAFAALWCSVGWGQAVPLREAGIYTCVDDSGKVITRDRYIAECRHKEQRILNRDGSVRAVVPPTLTPEEDAQREAAARAAREAEAARVDAVKYDQLLLRRFPDETAHQRLRENALVASKSAVEAAQARLRDLAAERKRLLEEAEFYRGRAVPLQLKQQLDANEAQAEAQRNAIRNAQAEQRRINTNFDLELIRLRKLWDGAAPGSLGPPPK
jgi:hypothetical protein